MRYTLIFCLVLFIIGCGQKSIPYSQNADSPEPNDVARRHDNWGLAYAKVGDLSQAISEFKLAIESEPRWALPHYNLGSVYGNLGLIDNAIVAWERATQLDTEFAKAYYNLAVVYAVKAENALGSDGKRRFIDQSIDSLREAIRVDKSTLSAVNMEEAFDSIRNLSEFKALFKETKTKQ